MDDIDRDKFDDVWRSMSHRRLLTPPMVDVQGGTTTLGEAVTVTISEDPPQYAHIMTRRSEICAVCGATTVETIRLPVSLHPTFANGYTFMLGAWVHTACFEACPITDERTPIPW